MSQTSSDSNNRTLTRRDLGEALYHGEARCEGCGERVDMSDLDTVEEAKERWNEHIREEHGDENAGGRDE